MPGAESAAMAEATAAIVRYGRRLVADRLVVGAAGNLSIKVGDTIVMSPSGLSYDQVTEETVNVLAAELSRRGVAASARSVDLSGGRFAEATNRMLAELLPRIEKTKDLVQGISAASGEQSIGAGQVNQAVQQLEAGRQALGAGHVREGRQRVLVELGGGGGEIGEGRHQGALGFVELVEHVSCCLGCCGAAWFPCWSAGRHG